MTLNDGNLEELRNLVERVAEDVHRQIESFAYRCAVNFHEREDFASEGMLKALTVVQRCYNEQYITDFSQICAYALISAKNRMRRCQYDNIRHGRRHIYRDSMEDATRRPYASPVKPLVLRREFIMLLTARLTAKARGFLEQALFCPKPVIAAYEEDRKKRKRSRRSQIRGDGPQPYHVSQVLHISPATQSRIVTEIRNETQDLKRLMLL